MNFDVIDIISLITVFQLVIFSFFLAAQYKRRLISNNILAAFLISNALYIIDFFIKRHRSDFISMPYLFNIGNTFGLLFGPLLFFYTKSLILKNFKFTKKDFLHLIPFIVFLIYYIIIYHIKPNDVKSNMLLHGYLTHSERVFSSLFLNIQTLVYMTISLVLLFRYSGEIKKYYSSIEKINLSWLKLVLFAFIIMWFVDLLSFVIYDLLDIRNHTLLVTLVYISLTINMVFAALIIFKGLIQSNYFTGIDITPHQEEVKVKKPDLAKTISNVDVENLKSHMLAEKSFLNPSLTLNELATQLGWHPRYLSQLINDSLGQNFYDFVNRHRIEFAKQLLKKEKFNVLEIIYEAGFNSKSVFNTVFKKNTGLTPTQFRKQHSAPNKEFA